MTDFRPPLLKRSISLQPDERRSLRDEWIITNGLGGYASGTLAGINSRRFHGRLIAALPPPHGRTMMLNRLEETLAIGGERYTVVAEDLPRAAQQDLVSPTLVEFRLEDGLPVWTYRCSAFELQKRACMVHGQNTTVLRYSLLRGEAACLELRPSIDIRPHEGALAGQQANQYRLTASAQGYEIACKPEIPPLL